jgi:dTDP-glucose 4,6-dehydratase
MTHINPLAHDLDHILQHTAPLWNKLRNQKIFITGGTGFFGSWLLETLAWANLKLDVNIKAVVLTRNPDAFASKCPHLALNPALYFYQGDVRNFRLPTGDYSHIIHAATAASSVFNANQPLAMLDTIIEGTRHTLDFAKTAGTQNFLYISSGAVYGKQPHHLSHLTEDYPCQPDLLDARSAYSVGKCTAEHLCYLYGVKLGLAVKIARCFAFIGPYLPLDGTYAAGNFIRDSLYQDTITIQGDGTTYRSYLYAADLVIWLLTILLQGESLRPYNVGSEDAVTIAELARLIANTDDTPPSINILQKALSEQPAERYIPSTQRAASELVLHQHISLSDAIIKTKKWHQIQKINTVVTEL